MSVNRTEYLMFGAKMDYSALDWDKHEAEVEGGSDAKFNLVVDFMGGEYIVAGKIIARSDGYDGIGFVEITADKLPQDANALAATISESFGVEISGGDLRLMLFSHYS